MKSRKAVLFIFALGVVLFMAIGATAQAAETPEWFFHDIVDAAFVQQYAKVPQPAGVMIIDSRPYKAKYAKGHIPTAVSIPHSNFDKMIDKLPKDNSTLLIFYCQGPT